MIWHDPTAHPSNHPPTHPPKCTPTHRWGSLHKFQIFKENWIILIFQVLLHFNWFGGHPLGVGGVGGWGCGVGWFTDFKSSNRIEISWFVQVLSHFNWFGGSPLGDVGMGGCGVRWFTDFKSSNRIQISWFIQVLSHFNRFGVPPFVVGGVGVNWWGSLQKFKNFKQN